MWLYGSGFPKSMNIGLAIDKKEGLQGQRGVGGFNVGGLGEQENRKAKLYIGSTTDGSKQKAYTDYKSDLAKQWQGWGTCLKPSFEPIIIARKPFKGTLVDNIIKYGVGGLNIDECRVGNEILHNSYAGNKNSGFTSADERDEKGKGMFAGNKKGETIVNGRFPANTILTYDENDFEEVCGGFPDTKKNGSLKKEYDDTANIFGDYKKKQPFEAYDDSGSASRYFYCAKASKKDRDEGLEEFGSEKVSHKNIHPTVKPTELMQYLVRLVSPKGAVILDPFMGSGSTGKAVAYENIERNADYKFIGIEMEKEYCKIAEARIKYVLNKD